MNSAFKSLLPALSFALVAAAPMLRAQDAAPAGAPSAASAAAPSPAPDAAKPDDAPPPPRRAKGGRMDPLAKVSNVTAEQKEAVAKIIADMREQMQAIPQEDRREKMPEMMKASRAKIRALLTADQQKEFDAASAQMQHGKRKKAAPDDAGAPPAPPPAN